MLNLLNAIGMRFLGNPDPTWLTGIVNGLAGVIRGLLTPVLLLVAVVGIIYAVVLGVEYAKAESADKKDEAKKRIINAAVGLVLMIVMLIAMNLLANQETIKEIIDFIESVTAG